MDRYRQRFKDIGIVFKCSRCGYDKCGAALDFHHLDPSKKDFTIASRVSVAKETLLIELAKCVILCRNCHSELHAGVWDIPSTTEIVP